MHVTGGALEWNPAENWIINILLPAGACVFLATVGSRHATVWESGQGEWGQDAHWTPPPITQDIRPIPGEGSKGLVE